MGPRFAIHAIPTSQLAAELAQHCAKETPILAKEGRAMAECRAINQARVTAINNQFVADGKSLLKLSAQIEGPEKKTARPTSEAARSYATAEPKKRLEQKGEAALKRWTTSDLHTAEAHLKASELHEAELIYRWGGIEIVMPTSADVSPGIDIQDPAARVKYYNEQISWRHEEATRDLEILIPMERERLQKAQIEFDKNPNVRTETALNEKKMELSESLDGRSHLWMEMQWLARLRDESAQQVKWGWARSLLDQLGR